ncbi:selenide, water dikinase SelD [Aliiroseovarius subalbicans]
MPHPLTRDLVFVGGGHAHALALRMWAMDPLPGVRLTLINPGPTAPYSGMLPGRIAGHYGRAELDIDLVRLARFAGARLILAPATGIDPLARTVTVEGRGAIGYDVASIDVGIHAEMPDIPGFRKHGIGAKPLDVYDARWQGFLTDVAAGQAAPEVVVIGGGVAGVELALAMRHALAGVCDAPRVTVLERTPDITGPSVRARSRLHQAMSAAGVQFRGGVTVARVTADAVQLSDGAEMPSAFTVGAAGAFAHPWLAGSALPVTDEGFVTVDDTLRVTGVDDLFAVGDCAHMPHAPRPKAGVFAVRAAPVLRDNLRAALSGGTLRPFRPQRNYLKLVSLGSKVALAEKWGVTVQGAGLWRWKDRIDQKFMDQFRDLPAMTAPAQPAVVALGLDEAEASGAKALCGGCGSKVGADTLRNALKALPPSTRDDVLSGPGDDAAELEIGGQRQVMTTDHLRAFTHDHGLLARITAVHALGDIWAMGAAPQAALVSVTLPHMTPALQERSMGEIMAAAQDVLGAAGAEIVGGHSTMGAELTIGFSLTGLCDDAPITNTGARAGDALILTRPIGTGTLLAGEMAGQADGRDVARMLTVMARPQGDAAAILGVARAMTDVTGFGLAGHLLAICKASGLAGVLDLEAVPTYDGALALTDAGVRSTIFASNRDAAPVAGATGARGDLLHDPQTAGGLLAAVAVEEAEGLLAQLRAAGHDAALIGQLEVGPATLRCR